MTASSSRIVLASIVEGHGEEKAVPRLLARLANQHCPGSRFFTIPAPQRLQRDRMFKTEHLGSYLSVAASQVQPYDGAIFLFLDADYDAACELGPRLLQLASGLRSDMRIVVCASESEFEAVFIAAQASLSLRVDAPYNVQDAKGQIRRSLGGVYGETIDQPDLVQRMALDEALTVPHIARLDRKLRELFTV